MRRRSKSASTRGGLGAKSGEARVDSTRKAYATSHGGGRTPTITRRTGWNGGRYGGETFRGGIASIEKGDARCAETRAAPKLQDIAVGTFNVRGVNEVGKRQMLEECIKRCWVHVLLIQNGTSTQGWSQRWHRRRRRCERTDGDSHKK